MAAKLTPLGNLAEPVGRYASEALLRADDTLDEAYEAIRDGKAADAAEHAKSAQAWLGSIERLAGEAGVEVDEVTAERIAITAQSVTDVLTLSGGSAKEGKK